jgi:GNAT superfamily N-acetyltransferase
VALTHEQAGATSIAGTSSTETSDPLRLWVPDPLDERLVSYHVTSDTELGDRAEQFVYENYREQGYCRESPRRWVEEVDQWREGSVLHVICDGDEVLGVLRTIIGTFEELPVSQFERTREMRPGNLLDGGSLVVKADYRGVGLATELYRHWIEVGIRNRVEGFCLLMDDGLVDVLHQFYALPTHAFAERRHYMGGDIEPLVVWLDEMLEQLSLLRPNLYKLAISGFTPEELVEFDLPIVLS